MRKATWILLVMLIALQVAGYSQVSNKDEMVKRVFEVLKNKDEQGFIKLYPDAVTIKQLLGKLMASRFKSDTTGEIKREYDRKLEGITDSMLAKELHAEFKKYIDRGENIGIDWSKTVFVSYTSDSTFKPTGDFAISELSGKIYFNYNSKEYFLLFSDIIYFEKGWYGVEINRVVEIRNDNGEYSQEGTKMTEEELQAQISSMDTTKVQTNKKVSTQKPRPAVKKQTAKSKTQSPAKKSD